MKEPNEAAGDIAVAGDCAFYRPARLVSLQEALELVDQAVRFARDRGIPKLLINATGLTGFPSPSLPERYFFARRLATSAQGAVKLALVVQAEMIDPERFGVMVARNAGLNANVFAAEPEALAWLVAQPQAVLSPQPPAHRHGIDRRALP